MSAWAVMSQSCQYFPVYLHKMQVSSGLQIHQMVPIHQDRGSKVTNVVHIFRLSVGWPDIFNFHCSGLGLRNGVTLPSEVEILNLITKSKSIRTIQTRIRQICRPFFQGYICKDSTLAVEIYYRQLVSIFDLVAQQYNTIRQQENYFPECPSWRPLS